MNKKAIHPAAAPLPAGPYNHAIIANGFVFVSGQTPEYPGTDEVVPGGIKEQTHQVMKNIQAILEAAGSTMADIVKVDVHLKDLADFMEFNQVYGQYVSEPYPARITVQSVLFEAVLLEVSVTALAGE
ncbi:Rid family detoxifying hydrolase [Anoxynatronum sibiricum]|uniref:Rid family detoxifying hydrolase n=1 Tax=Anoxynatronum sibiricum TaxID=210623 RepID=A0ABU9VTT3_9CLOT